MGRARRQKVRKAGLPGNPYLNRAMIRGLDQFFGRRREIGRAMARIGASPPQSVSLVGERRAGKSSLLWHLAQPEIQARYLESPERYVFVLLDFQGQQHLDLPGFCRVFSGYVQASLGSRLEVEAAGDYRGLEALVRCLAAAGLKLVGLLDEFETVTRNPAFGAEFFGFLRALANAHPVAFVTASRRQLQSLCHDRQIAESPFFNIFAQVRLGPLLEEEARELVRVPSARAGVPLENHTEALLRLGGRLPFFLQMACSAAWECLMEAGNRRLEWEEVERRFQEEAAGHFRYVWEHLAEEERGVVAALAAGQALPAEEGTVLRRLTAEGYLEQRQGRYALFSEGFARFLREEMAQTLPAKPQVRSAPPARAEVQIEPVPEGEDPFPQIIGHSAALRRVFALMHRAIASEATALLLGETGTGKELVARTIHERSAREKGPFVAVNCGAIAEHLQESELFGHKKGAFTDALADREGLFEAAEGGTLFLDEIGETSPATQVKLLRALQEGEIRRVGENQARKVDVRLMLATNRDLEQEVQEGRFRQDLYYRLYVLAIELPPLRQRREDIPLLVAHFLEGYEGGLSEAALERLRAYDWPGNIRELENQLESAKALAGGGRIGPGHLWPRVQGARPEMAALPEVEIKGELTLKEAREVFEARLVQARLEQYGGDLAAAARSLGVSRSRLYELVRRYGL